jgi:hypothetical protein
MDLTSIDGLRSACEEVMAAVNADSAAAAERWNKSLVEFLQWIDNADEATRTTLEFQKKLWDDNSVSATGQGNIDVQGALQDEDFRKWLAAESVKPLPEIPGERDRYLISLYDELVKRLEPHCRLTPKLKILRVLAALYPQRFTSVAHQRRLNQVHKALFARRRREHPVIYNSQIVDRLTEVLGQVGNSREELAQRMSLPWWIYAKALVPAEEDSTEVIDEGVIGGATKLVPLPAERRRRGLTAIGGGLQTILGILDVVGLEVTREELLEHIRTILPNYKDSSLNTVINSLVAEYAVIRNHGGQYQLTERGEAFLETGDPGELADWLLTRILGVDLAIAALRDHGPMNNKALIATIQSANPSWKSNYMPSSILGWLRHFGVCEDAEDSKVGLTASGKAWAERITWAPQRLPPVQETSPETTIDREAAATETAIEMPSVEKIIEKIRTEGAFPESVIAVLHSGLWAHHRRHFAVLTGISGSGKTLLAHAYARAVTAGDGSDHRSCIVAVQPGWYEPSALMGYVNPLRGDAYVRTPFLEFVLAAAGDPSRPYVAVLDEMNLSHPEQYLAPILSAMETGAAIDLHREGELFDGVPSSTPYPANLVLIGTVNMDETTHGLSDKVLDRAYTLEFWDIDLDQYPRWGTRQLPQALEAQIRAMLAGLIEALAPTRLHFGWRVVDDVLDFVERMTESAIALPSKETLDSVVYAKVLPKLRGDDTPRLRAAFDAVEQILAEHELARCREKLAELRQDLESTGSARFWR